MSDGLSGGGSLPVAGWYPDPAGTPQERWWGGLDWTDHLRDVPSVAPVWPQAAIGAPSTPAWLPVATAAPVTPAYQPMAGWGTETAQAQYNPAQAQYYTTATGSPNTVPIWLIATYPVPLVLAQLWIRTLPLELYLAAALGVSGVFLAVIIGATLWDFFTLRSRGLPAASPLWLLLSPIGFLIARRIVLGHAGVRHNSPGNVFVIVLIVSAALFAFASSQLGGTPSLTVNELEAELEKELLSQSSQVWDVTCPPDAAITVVGTEFTCTATDPSGRSAGVSFRVTPQGLESVGTG